MITCKPVLVFYLAFCHQTCPWVKKSSSVFSSISLTICNSLCTSLCTLTIYNSLCTSQLQTSSNHVVFDLPDAFRSSLLPSCTDVRKQSLELCDWSYSLAFVFTTVTAALFLEPLCSISSFALQSFQLILFNLSISTCQMPPDIQFLPFQNSMSHNRASVLHFIWEFSIPYFKFRFSFPFIEKVYLYCCSSFDLIYVFYLLFSCCSGGSSSKSGNK